MTGSMYPIEKAFGEMCEATPRNQFFYEKYIVFKNVLREQFYEMIPVEYKGYTKHTYGHIQGILLQVDRLCAAIVDKARPDDPKYINVYELYLLLMSIIFHDVAMLVEKREKHSDLKKIFDLFDSVVISEDEKDWIKRFVKCHPSSTKIEEKIPFADKLINNWPVHPQFLAAVLRLADELDENKGRSDETGMKLGTIKAEQSVYHQFGKIVDGIKPEPRDQKINIEITVPGEMVHHQFKKSKTVKVSFIKEIIDRVNKMNDARRYCMGFAAYYLDVKTIDLKLCVKNGEDIETVSFVFDDRKNAVDFWKKNKHTFDKWR
jgi:hypothetical protein